MPQALPRVVLAAVFVAATSSWAADPPKPPDPRSVEQLAESARKSVVVITVTGRDGKRQGLGTGFVVAADGLIATNLHVIGEARPITVQLADGKKHPVTSVHASDRSLDLALVRIDAKGLTPLELGDSDKLKQGAPVVVLGNPQGLEHSVTAGVVSGRREIDGRKMLQLAVPVEPGNSGGPVLDMHGRVQGIVTLKSAVTANLGFAVPVNRLKPLIEKPNPVAMERWLTIGALDPEEWKPLFGARWRRRAGRLLVEEPGAGFGGRSLCLSQQRVPELPYEIAVTVKLDDESGAAGLVFHADGGDRHYGFYPSGGGLRLTRFDGPDVLSWKILHQGKASQYRPGGWNTLKVRVEKDRVRCFVNDQFVVETAVDEPAGAQVGLCKFRQTRAEFKHFRIAKRIAPDTVPAEVTARVTKLVEKVPVEGPAQPELIDNLAPEGQAGLAVLRERARRLEQQAAQLRELAHAVHRKRVQDRLVEVLRGPEDDIDLLHAALLIAQLDNDELDVDAYRRDVDRLAKKLRDRLPKEADEAAKLAALNTFLFADRGFHGSRGDYYNRSNSYLNEVIDDREGLPITLSVLYIELARRVGVRLAGVGMPGHFVVKTVPAKGEPTLIDVYEAGKVLTRDEAAKKVEAITGVALRDEHLAATPKRAIVVRMLHNLTGVARSERDGPAMLRYLDAILAIAPDEAADRWLRARLRFASGQRQGAIADADWLLEKKPADLDLDAVREFRRLLEKE